MVTSMTLTCLSKEKQMRTSKRDPQGLKEDLIGKIVGNRETLHFLIQKVFLQSLHLKCNKVFFEGAPPVNGYRITCSKLINL